MITLINRTIRFWIMPFMLILALGCDDNFVNDSPNAPTNLRTATVGDGHTELIWDSNSSIEDGFIIEKSEDNTAEFVEIARVQASTYVDTAPMLLTKTYQYRVAAYRGQHVSEYSNTISLSYNLEIPGTFRVDTDVTDQVKLTWATNNNPSSQIYIERSPTGSDNWSTLATTPHSGSFIDATATTPGPWYYRIAQVSASNQTAFTEPVGAVYGLAITETKTANKISNYLGCPLSYQSFALPDQDLLLQFSKAWGQINYSFYISRLSDGSMMTSNSITDSQLKITVTPNQLYFLSDSNPGNGRVLQLHRTSDGGVVNTIRVSNQTRAGIISNSKAIALVQNPIVGKDELVEIDINSGEISFVRESVSSELVTTSTNGHYLLVENNGIARVYDQNHLQVATWNIGSFKKAIYSQDGDELMVQYGESIETFNTTSYNRKIQVDLKSLYSYASYSPDQRIYTTYCNHHPLPSTWIQSIDSNSGQVERISVRGKPVMTYVLSSGKMLVAYTDSIRTYSNGWMPAITHPWY